MYSKLMKHRKRDQRDCCQGGKGRGGWAEKVKGNIVNSNVISLHGDR